MKKILMMAAVAGAIAAGASTTVLPYGDVRLKGPMGERLNKMIEHHLKATDVDYITAPFLEKTERGRRWQTEFWGKFMHAAMPFWTYTQDAELRKHIDFGFERICASQEPSGYIGNYPDELRCGEGWDVWGMKYTMMGLMHYADGLASDDPRRQKALTAARRVCDYVIDQLGPNGKRGYHLWESGNWCGFASSSILEPVVWLYNRTKDKKYLDFATYLVKDMTEVKPGPRLLDLALKDISVADRNGYDNKAETHGGYVMKHNRWKAYEMMSCYQGLIEYYEATGRKDLLEAAVKTCDQIIRDEINIAGGSASSEAWFHGAQKQHLPYMHLQETCVVTTWMRFVEKLLQVTEDPKYADELEKAFYNIYLASLNRDATEFAAYTPLNGYRSRGHHHCAMHTNCCNANGPRGFLAFLRALFQTDGETAIFNFYASSSESVYLPKLKEKVAFDIYTIYPAEGNVRIVNHTVQQMPFTVKLRIPAWSAKTVVKVNGRPVDGVKAGTYCTIARTWTIGDVVEIFFDMTTRAHVLNNHVAFTRGPIALARDTRFNDGDINEVFRRRSIKDGQAMEFAPVRAPSEDIWMAYSASLPIGTHTEHPDGRRPQTVFFCDYASAGNLWQPSNAYRVWFPMEFGPADK